MINFYAKKKIALCIVLSFFIFQSNAQKISVYDQLVYVNNEWKNQTDVDPALKMQPAKSLNEHELVRMHLMQTEKLLRARSTAQLTPLQKRNREINLTILHGYWEKGIFPLNNAFINRQPIFIDEKNTYCAVGYLMKETGADAMAKEINQTQNFSYLIDIYHPDLMKWATNSGLTFNELALIQPGYGGEWPCAILEMHYNNSGADVNEFIKVHQSNGRLTGEDAFDSLFFYDYNNVLYKKLSIEEMDGFAAPAYYAYQFPSSENFADSGKIEFYSKTDIFPPYIFPGKLLSRLTYNSTGIVLEDFSRGTLTTRTYAIAESESTPSGYSLTFCGKYTDSTWSANILLATPINSINACLTPPLPVTLLNFDYSINNNKNVALRWQSTSEVNSQYFDVEKSADGIHFSSIGKINAVGNNTSINNYSFEDNLPGYINYYRLKQVDNNGQFTYSKILYAKIAPLNALVVEDNTVTDNLKIRITSPQSLSGKLLLYDYSGRTLRSITAKAGEQNINTSALAKGIYILRLISTDGKAYTATFIKN